MKAHDETFKIPKSLYVGVFLFGGSIEFLGEIQTEPFDKESQKTCSKITKDANAY